MSLHAKTIGNQILIARRELGLSQEELGKKIGKVINTISRWEKGHTSPTFEEIAKIANVTGKPLDFFLPTEIKKETIREAGNEKKDFQITLSPEIIEALSDPDAVSALLSTFQSKEDIKPIIQDVIWNLNHLSKEQRKEMLKYCQ